MTSPEVTGRKPLGVAGHNLDQVLTPFGLADHHLNHVLTLKEAARIASISVATLRRRIADGTGPAIVRPSIRRVGVRLSALAEWLDRASQQNSNDSMGASTPR
jgi:predicted DNA-binding transcriptional regulator AlpA